MFRADGNSKIGMGHITRCIALAKVLKKYGDVQFISKPLPVKLPFKVNPMPENCDDVALTRSILKRIKSEIVIVDHHALDQSYLDSIRAFTDLLVVIDDLKRELRADVIVNVNAFSLRMKYRSPGKAFLGPKYALVEMVGRNAIRKKADRILVSMGGADILNLTPKVIRALSEVDDVKVTVVIGPAFENEVEIIKAAGDDSRFSVVRTNKLQKLMLRHDVAVCGGGTTLYELAATGAPAVILCQARNQLINARELHKKTVLNLGMGDEVSRGVIKDSVKNMLHNYTMRIKFSNAGTRLVDCKGPSRVAKIIMAESKTRKIELKPASVRDSVFVLKLRNEKTTRMNSFNTNVISFAEHRKWFYKTLQSANRKLYVIYNNAKRIGYVRIDRGNPPEMHIAVSSKYRKLGFGSRAIVLACALYDNMTASIKSGNDASIKAFENAGFKILSSNDKMVTMSL